MPKLSLFYDNGEYVIEHDQPTIDREYWRGQIIGAQVLNQIVGH